MGIAPHRKTDSSGYMSTSQQSLPAVTLLQMHSAASLQLCTLQATHLQQPTKRGLYRIFKPGLKIFPLFQVKEIFPVCVAAH